MPEYGLCVTIEEGPGIDAGGPQYVRSGVELETCSPQASDRQRWTMAAPQYLLYSIYSNVSLPFSKTTSPSTFMVASERNSHW